MCKDIYIKLLKKTILLFGLTVIGIFTLSCSKSIDCRCMNISTQEIREERIDGGSCSDLEKEYEETKLVTCEEI